MTVGRVRVLRAIRRTPDSEGDRRPSPSTVPPYRQLPSECPPQRRIGVDDTVTQTIPNREAACFRTDSARERFKVEFAGHNHFGELAIETKLAKPPSVG